MVTEFKAHIEKELPFLQGRKLLVACSGGVDSVALYYLLKSMGFDLALAHCNFNLRGKESDKDEEFVSDLAEKNDLPFYTESFETEVYAKNRKISVQMAARELRYTWFEEIRRDFNYDFVLTAHHADDSIETFFINLQRSSGLKGLSGIPQVNQQVVRPLLPFHKDQILEYAKSEGLYWREDTSNRDSKYLRNKIRNELIPALNQVSPDLGASILRTQEYLRNSEALIEDYMVLITQLTTLQTDQGLEIDIDKLKELPNSIPLLYELLSPYGFTSWDDINALIDAQSGKQVFSNSHRVLKNRNTLILTEHEKIDCENVSIDQNTYEILTPVHLSFSEVKKFEITNAFTAFVDKDKLVYPLTLRKWEDGDWFFPFGMKGRKKLSKYFKDEKLSLVAKEKSWVLCSGEDILWVVGMRLDDRFKVTKETKNILKLEYIPE